MKTTAIFPLIIMRRACHWSARGFHDARFFNLPPLVVNEPAARNVHCGNLPLVRNVYVCAFKRFDVGASCYINTSGEFCFPG